MWAENFFSGTRGDYMIVACFKDHPVGFTQIVRKNDSGLIIDLIGVDSHHHGIGLASAMINFLLNFHFFIKFYFADLMFNVQ